MKDLINEQPEQDIDHCGNCIHSADSLEICVLRTCKYAIGELIDCYEPKQLEQRWIPCSERLPEDFQPFYATCRSNIDNRENWVIEGWYSPWRGFNPPPLVAEGKAEIIAWMPKELPEPYKEDDK